jgi:glycosyltransferase involved in cell wall biosynthesis
MMAATPGPTVIQVVLSLSPGGTERLVVELARRLQPSFGMAVCCLDSPGSWAHLLTDRGIPVIALNRRPGFRPLLGRAIAQFAADRRATVVHCHHYSPFVYGSLARLWRRSGIVFTEHGRLNDDRPSNRRRLANRLFDRVPARIFAVSNNLRTFMIEEGFSQDHVDVIRNGIDLGPLPTARSRADARSRLGISPDDFVVGAIGRLDPVKSLETLIDAMGSMIPGDGRRARLVLIGEGPERRRLEAHVAAAGASGVVTFTGHRSDVRELLPALDVYVNCSVFEGISLTILEAMAAELPVVASRVGGTPEVVVDGECGYLVEPRDPRALAGAVSNLREHPELGLAFGSAARARVEKHFSIDRMVQQYANVYSQVGG